MPQPADNPESIAEKPGPASVSTLSGEAMARANSGQAPEVEDTLRKPPSNRAWRSP